MRMLVSLGDNDLLPRDETAEVLAALAVDHELVLVHGERREAAHLLELGLRNALPDRDLVTVLTEVVIGADDPAAEPRAIAELHSLRLLIGAGVLVICAADLNAPVAVDGAGAMDLFPASVDGNLTAALLARRLDADLLLLPGDDDRGDDAKLLTVSPGELRKKGMAAVGLSSKREAACRFVEATGRRAAIGPLADAVAVAHGAGGTQITARGASRANV